MARRKKVGQVRLRAKLDPRAFDALLSRFEQSMRQEALVQAVTAGGEALLAGVQSRMPQDKGTAKGALKLDVTEPREGVVVATVSYDTAAVLAASDDHYLYPIVIEFGAGHRAPVAPMRRTIDEDSPKLQAAISDSLREALPSL